MAHLERHGSSALSPHTLSYVSLDVDTYILLRPLINQWYVSVPLNSVSHSAKLKEPKEFVGTSSLEPFGQKHM